MAHPVNAKKKLPVSRITAIGAALLISLRLLQGSRVASAWPAAYLSETGLRGTIVEIADLNSTFCLLSFWPCKVMVYAS
ncbi:hypothetical protein [Paenibacillus tepidiphilus]|uniref:hypothetical protein n=1 Tax=Paenibacillus tepidiphilus TaxID=2608683 RepID=UPI0013A554E6